MGGCGSVPKPSKAHQCDEYPMLRTNKGGVKNYPKYVSLNWVPGSENGRVGGYYGALSKALRKKLWLNEGFLSSRATLFRQPTL